MTNLPRAILFCLGAAMLTTWGCGEANGAANAGTGGNGTAGSSSSGGATSGGQGSGAGPQGGSKGGDTECPSLSFTVKWQDLNELPCASEGLMCQRGSDSCGPGTLVATSEVLSCIKGKWFWPGYHERVCCPDATRLAVSEGTPCKDEGLVCYGSGAAECEPMDVLTCTAGTWQFESQRPEACNGGAGGSG